MLSFCTFFVLMLAPADWPAFMGPDQNGISRENNIVRSFPENGPPVLWRAPVGNGYAGPAVVDGRVFVFDQIKNEARLSCYAAKTGKLLWREVYESIYKDMYGYSNGPRAMPVVDGDRVYTYGVEGVMHCRRVSDGSVIWKRDLNAEYGVVQNFFGVGAVPVIYKNLLIAQVGGSPAGSPSISSGKVQGNGSGVVAFDKMTGKTVYKISDELASYAAPRITTHGGRDWGLVLARGGLLTFEPGSGKIDFHFPYRSRKLESVNASSPAVFGDKVLLTESYGLGAAVLRFTEKEPEVIWQDPPKRNQAMASHWTTPIIYKGYLYGCHGVAQRDAELRCLDPETGEIKWSEPKLQRTTMILAGDILLVLSEKGELILVRATPERYNEMGRVALVKAPAWHPPALADGLAYIRGSDQLVCVDLNK